MREISLHVLDLAQNSIAANATEIFILLEEDLATNCLRLMVRDNGHGMTKEQCRKALDPFYTTRTARKVGLGLALLQAAAERAAGQVRICSELGKGTTVFADFMYDHIDRAPIGDMAATLVSIITLNEQCHITYRHRRDQREFTVSSRELKQELAGMPLNHPQVVAWLGRYMRELEKTLEV
ncbi:MAG: sensor histidine kinase [Firmicutes bacterium]|nr:sensor histidine kinase [Bacillota bacterium]